MTVSDVVINLLCKKTIILKNRREIANVFNGQGYPHTYGFCKAGYDDGDWYASFREETSKFDVMNRKHHEASRNINLKADEIYEHLKHYNYI